MSRWIFLSCSALLLWCSACSSSPPAHSAPGGTRDPGAQLLETGRRLVRLGEGVRAEQYFLAAADAGVEWERVFVELVQLCVASGRLRSALEHVRRSRKLRPEDPELLQLSASLHWALGYESRALRDAETLSGMRPLAAETWFFLGEFALETERPRAAKEHFERFLALRPDAEEAAWARVTVRRLEAQSALLQRGENQ